jgi:hypothetical protein
MIKNELMVRFLLQQLLSWFWDRQHGKEFGIIYEYNLENRAMIKRLSNKLKVFISLLLQVKDK